MHNSLIVFSCFAISVAICGGNELGSKKWSFVSRGSFCKNWNKKMVLLQPIFCVNIVIKNWLHFRLKGRQTSTIFCPLSSSSSSVNQFSQKFSPICSSFIGKIEMKSLKNVSLSSWFWAANWKYSRGFSWKNFLPFKSGSTRESVDLEFFHLFCLCQERFHEEHLLFSLVDSHGVDESSKRNYNVCFVDLTINSFENCTLQFRSNEFQDFHKVCKIKPFQSLVVIIKRIQR